MNTTRREFCKQLTVLGAGTAGLCLPAGAARAADDSAPSEGWMGVLVDIPNCIGCRRCEFACQEAAGFDVPPMETFEDQSVMAVRRRPSPESYTVVNRYENPAEPAQPAFVKVNCLHCNHPACVSACLVGALTKNDRGAVVYDAWKCMGCRYCMVACPFQIPTYDYGVPLTPEVRKCNFCASRIADRGTAPACVTICPRDCLIYGKRGELLELAHAKIRARPDLYVDHVYGEHEAGGTSWLYLSGVPFEKLDVPMLGSVPPSRLTEMIQHGIFKHWFPPAALYGLLGVILWINKTREEHARRLGEDARTVQPERRRRGRDEPQEQTVDPELVEASR